MRQVGFCLLANLLQCLPFIKHLTKKEMIHSWQEWIIEAVMSVQPLTPIGFYKGPGEPYSLVLCTLSTPEELQNRHPDKLGAMVSWLTSTYHAQIYSFAGILPSLLHKHNQWPTSMNPRSDRLVKGADATTFMVMENVLQVQERHKTDPLTKNIVIIGAGFIGSQVANKCAEMGLDVRALDIRMNVREKLDDRVKFYHEDVESAVKDAHLIVLLTMVGDDGVAGLMQYVESGMVIISDTYPKISKEIIYQLNTVGVTVYESALTREGVNFFPKLPKWKHDTIPGCLGEAFVKAALPPFQYDGSHNFTWNARRVLKARLDDGMGPKQKKLRNAVVFENSTSSNIVLP
jgi:hypothetical protein